MILFDYFCILEDIEMKRHLGELELLILISLLRLGDGAYGVLIARDIEEATGRAAALGSIYAALERMESGGLVESELGEATAERGGKAKRYFRLTPAGEARLRSTQRALETMWRGLPELGGVA